MIGLVALLRRLLGSLVELGRLVAMELVLGGGVLMGLLAVVGIVLFAVAFGVAGYAVVGAVGRAVGRRWSLSGPTRSGLRNG